MNNYNVIKTSRHGRKHHIAALCIPLLLLLLIQAPEGISYRVVSSTGTTASVFLKPYHGRTSCIACYAAIEDKDPSMATSKWTESIDESVEKLESVKAAAASLLLGSLVVSPFSLVEGLVDRFSPYWQVQHVALSIGLLLFGITYRYAVRGDNNPHLKQGVVGAFGITRALSLVTLPPAPQCGTGGINQLLDCGPPFHLFTVDMLGVGLVNLTESFIAFGGTAYILEYLFRSNLLKRFPSSTKASR